MAKEGKPGQPRVKQKARGVPARSEHPLRPLPRGYHWSATNATRRRYDRIAPVYDLVASVMGLWYLPRWRSRLWSRVSGGRVLEVGVGTGRNMPYYPASAMVTAVDLSTVMLERASRRAQRLKASATLAQMTVEALALPDSVFDYVIATFVFCSVPDQVAGLREVARVCKPEGTILLLEHTRIERPIIGSLMDIANPLAVRLTGANINRRTVENLRLAGLFISSVEDQAPMGLVKLITSHPTARPGKRLLQTS